ncbi:retrovirus-related Pol polyprotein from transposon opus [Trichonephila clavipes]|nr:retrovirus-related Pol polyprotein from transposon opus [Trichonephila clavipes]
MEAIPIPEITAEIVGRAFYEKWICRFGVPVKLVTDQGRQFEAELFRSKAAICGAKVAYTTSYHPQCNGKVKRLHRTLKGAIKARNNIRWTESLPTVLLGLRAAIRPDISYTIAQMVYGTSIKLPVEFFDPPTINMDPQNFVAKLQQHMAELKPLKSPSNRKQNIMVHKDLKSCSHVFIRIDRVKKALEPPYEGPYTVQKNSCSPPLSPVSFAILASFSQFRVWLRSRRVLVAFASSFAPPLPFFGFLLMSASVPLSPSILSRSTRSLSLAIVLIFVRSFSLERPPRQMGRLLQSFEVQSLALKASRKSIRLQNREFKDYIEELKRLNQNNFPTTPSPSKAKRGTQKRSTTSVPGTSEKKQRAGERQRSGNTTPPPTTAIVEEALSAMEDDSSADESSSEATTTKVTGPIDAQSARVVIANGTGDLTDTEGDDFTVVARKKKVASIVIDASQNTTGLLNTLSEHLGTSLEGRFENGKLRIFPKTIREH